LEQIPEKDDLYHPLTIMDQNAPKKEEVEEPIPRVQEDLMQLHKYKFKD